MKQGGLLQDIAAVLVIRIYDTDIALAEQAALALHVFLKAGMLIFPDVVGSQIRFIPPMGGIDFSPVVAIIALQLVQRLVLQLLIGILV